MVIRLSVNIRREGMNKFIQSRKIEKAYNWYLFLNRRCCLLMNAKIVNENKLVINKTKYDGMFLSLIIRYNGYKRKDVERIDLATVEYKRLGVQVTLQQMCVRCLVRVHKYFFISLICILS